MSEKLENDREIFELVLDDSSGRLRKIQFDPRTGLFRLQSKDKTSPLNEGAWVSGDYLKDELPSTVAGMEYSKAVEFVDNNDTQK